MSRLVRQARLLLRGERTALLLAQGAVLGLLGLVGLGLLGIVH
jgi:hypothetical protein